MTAKFLPVARARHILGAVALVTLLAGCGSMSSIEEFGSSKPAPSANIPRPQLEGHALDTLGLVAYAAAMQGKPYVSGGNTPEIGFDCSGLVYHVFRQFDLTVPRSAREMALQLPSISLSAIEAADLLFFDTQNAPYSHVGIYLGDGRFVHAPSPRTGRVIISQISNRYWRARLTGARRIEALNIETASIRDLDESMPLAHGSM